MNKCKKVGFQHLWREMPHVTLEFRTDGLYEKHRECVNCGKKQIMELKWKDDNSNITNIPRDDASVLGDVE